MKAYFISQIKRVFKLMPIILAVTILLCMALAVVFGVVLKLDSQSEKNNKFIIAIAGNTEDTYLDMGIKALETIDSSRFAIEFIHTDEANAKQGLKNGEISAIAVIPDNFVKSVMYGEIIQIKFYTSPDSVGMVTIFKDEITQAVSDILIHSQRGIYGLYHAMGKNATEAQAVEHMNELCIEYVDLILNRSYMYENKLLGISDGLSVEGYFLCGFVTLFFFLFGIACTPVFVKRDLSLNRILLSKGKGSLKQVISEFLAYLTVIMLMVAVVLLVISLIEPLKDIVPELKYMNISFALVLIVKLIPVIAMIASFHFILFELTSDIISGVLLQFLTAVAVTYISGCFYPIQFFPTAVQRASVYLPPSISRSFIACCLNEESVVFTLLMALIYIAVFITFTVVIRNYKLTGKRGK
ncbi:MAG: ABC transporter permease [Acutalibacteraceae bacterium]|nr:ABC transporter permease [Acutalibacteraceae bacterium]